MEKVLIISSVASMIDQFNKGNIKLLQNMGYEVHVATNFDSPGTITGERSEALKIYLLENKVEYFQIDFSRSPFNFKRFTKAYKNLLEITKEHNYKIVHMHSPVGGIIGRMVFKKKPTKVIYTAHGFHFYKGAPIKNWTLFYPIEKYFSKHTDCLITLNEEDYYLAKKKFKSNQTYLIPGVGVDLNRFKISTEEDNLHLRKKYGYSKSQFILIYVAELSDRKNQQQILEMSDLLKNRIQNLRILLVGTGPNEKYLKELTLNKKLDEIVEFLGYRTDVADLISISDVVVSTSKQEGLPVNILEGLAVGKPLIVTNSRGNRDLVENNINGFVSEINDYETMADNVLKLYLNKEIRNEFSCKSMEMSKKYDLTNVMLLMEEIYSK